MQYVHVHILCQVIITAVNLQADGTLLYLSGELHFLNNSGGEESTLHMLSFAQIVLSRGVYVNFEGNSGRSVNLSTRDYNTLEPIALSSIAKKCTCFTDLVQVSR